MREVRKRGWVVVAATAIVVLTLAMLRAQTPSGAFTLEARWITAYKSLCDVEPQRSPKSATIPPGGGWTIAGCSDLNGRGTVPLALVVTNKDSVSRQFEIPLLSEVTIAAGGSSAPAAAIYIPWGNPSGFATDLKGHLTVDVDAKSTVDLVYLFPKSGAAAKIRVKGYAAITPGGE